MQRFHPYLLATMLLASLIAGCGGGDDDDSAPQAGTQTPDAANPAGTAGANDANAAQAANPPAPYDCGLPGFQAELLQRLNTLRASGAVCGARGSFAPAAALAWNEPLTQAALGHATDMATNDYFSHTSRDGSTLAERVTRAGYEWSRVAENIAAGQPSVQSVMSGWTASDGHCANLMHPGLREVGLACVPGTGQTRYSPYWVMNLATPR